MNYSTQLKSRLIRNAVNYCNSKSFTGIKRPTAFLFNDIEMSFHPEAYKNITENKKYSDRLKKIHSKVPSIFEMQSSNSSDALLMNFFAHPRIKESKALRELLSIDQSDTIEFGWKPDHENEKRYKTEIDLKIGNSIFEAKLTEQDFKSKKIHIVLRYADVEKIIDLKSLTTNDIVSNYQLIRNLVTAKKYGLKFNLIIDESRMDLVNEFNKVKSAVIDKSLFENMKVITWQEIADTVEEDLKKYITERYF